MQYSKGMEQNSNRYVLEFGIEFKIFRVSMV